MNKDRFETDDVLRNFKKEGLQMSKEALSNLLGGIGYYHGPISIKKGNTAMYDSKYKLVILTVI
jgi:hypothetical protein